MATYLLTGVSRGVGRALAERLLAAGDQVYGITRGPVPELTGQVQLELTEFDSYPTALAELLTAIPRLDGFVHSAGIARPGRLTDQDSAAFTEQFAINVTAAAELVRLFLPALLIAEGESMDDVLAVATKGHSSPALVIAVVVIIVLVAIGVLVGKLRR